MLILIAIMLRNEDSDSLPDAYQFNNKFANDGTFMEMFKRMQQQLNEGKDTNSLTSTSPQCNKDSNEITLSSTEASSSSSSTVPTTSSSSSSLGPTTATTLSSPVNPATTTTTHSLKPTSSSISHIKRRSKTLKVGVIKRPKKQDDDEDDAKESGDAWSHYMSQVRKYKDKYGDDGDKNRPLVK